MQSKAEYVYHEMKKKRPIGVRVLEEQWEKMNANTLAPFTERKLIDWTKPLKSKASWIGEVKYLASAYRDGETLYACMCTRTSKDYTYIFLFDKYGNAAGKNANTISLYNEQTSWNKSAWMVLDRYGGHLSSRHATQDDAKRWAKASHGYGAASSFQYIRYDYVEST